MNLNWSNYPNFERIEFECNCGCGRADMDPAFMQRIQKMRNYVGPMKITSGFRCENHSEEKKKIRGGAHSIGHAADIQYSSARQLAAMLGVAENWGFKGIGVSGSFLHLDDDHPYLDRSNCIAWGY